MAIENMWEIGDHDGSLDDPHILCYSNSFNLSYTWEHSTWHEPHETHNTWHFSVLIMQFHLGESVTVSHQLGMWIIAPQFSWHMSIPSCSWFNQFDRHASFWLRKSTFSPSLQMLWTTVSSCFIQYVFHILQSLFYGLLIFNSMLDVHHLTMQLSISIYSIL